MKRWQKRSLFAVGFLSLVAFSIWLSLPSFVRWQIQKRHPEVQFSEDDVDLHGVTLHHVTIDKGWLKITADTAIIDSKTEAVALFDGTADIDLDKRLPRQGTSGSVEQQNVTADRFTVEIRSSARDVTATLRGVTVSERTITATSADVRHKWYHIAISSTGGPEPGLEVGRDLKRLKVGAVSFPDGLNLPSPMPATVHEGFIGIDVDIEGRTASVHTAGAELAEDQSVRVEVEDARFRLDGEKVVADIGSVKLGHPRLFTNGLPVAVRHVSLTVGRDWKVPTDVKIGDATIHVDPNEKSVSGDELCSTWVKSLPSELAPPPISGQTKWGLQPQLSRLKFSVGLLPKPHLSITGACSATCDDPAIVRLHHRFSYTTYDEKGARNPTPRETGPETPDWVPLSQISENMLDAVANMEDWGFWSHRGFSTSAFENSFVQDVKSDKFIRGGSTITMQLSKNVFLARDKTIGRKVSELFLSQVLESCFDKKGIMELYLNLVEFGPNVYGLRQAAAHYFKTEPRQLDPLEAFYLAWILPRPRASPPPNAATMARIGSLMTMLSKQHGRISEAQILSVEPADTTGWEIPR